MLSDFRQAIRALLRQPVPTFTAVITLALGIGANTAIFGVVYSVLLRPLPYPEADRSVLAFATRDGGRMTASPPDFVDWRREISGFEALAAFNDTSFAVSGAGGAAEQVPGAAVTSDFLAALGVSPALGRGLAPDDDLPGRPKAAWLGHGLWQRRFGGDPAIVGRSVRIDGESVEVRGVMPEGFSFPDGSELWISLAFGRDELETQRGAHYLQVVGRLRPEREVASVDAELRGLAERLAREHPGTNAGYAATVVPLRDALVGDVRAPLLVLLGAVGLVLLIA